MSQRNDSQDDTTYAEPSGEAVEAAGVPGRSRGDGAELDPDAEKELWRGHISWKHFADLIAIVLAWSLLAVYVGWSAGGWIAWFMFIITAVGWAFVLGRIAYGVLYYRYRLTTQRLFVEQGILGKTTDQTELIRVDDVRIKKTLSDRMTGLGSVLVMSTDTSDPKVTLLGVAEPERIADAIRQNMRELRQQALYVEHI